MNVQVRRVLTLLVILAFVVTLFPASSVVAKQPKVHVWLTVLHNNDGESKLINLGSTLTDFGGVARFKTLVDQLKWSATQGVPSKPGAKRAVLMVSSGDNFLAGPEFNISLLKGPPFYDTIAMDLIGYDAVAIGNHDFDFGPDVLEDFILGYEKTKPPYLSSNLDFTNEPGLQALKNQNRIAASTVVKTRGETFGIIGATTPMLRFISSPRNVAIVDDVAGAIMVEVNKLTAMGVNKIILISHLQSVEEDLSLITHLSGVDIVVAGGGDEVLANDGDLLVPGHTIYGPYPIWAQDAKGMEVPVVTSAGNYAYVGQLVAGFDKAGNLLEIDAKLSGPKRVAGGNQPDAVSPNPEVQQRVVDPLVAELADMANNVVAVSAVNLDGRRVPIRSVETNQGNLIADSLHWQATQLAGVFGVPAPDVALQNGGGIRNNTIIPAGNITELDTFAMVPFPNFVSVVENVSREQFKEILENAVSRVEFGDGRFAQVSGFRFTWDATQPARLLDTLGNVTQAGSRVREVVLDNGTVIVAGGVVQAGDALTVATIDFLARGGDRYPFSDAPFTTLGVTYQQALYNFLTVGLGGVITSTDYPEGGEGRITRLN